MSNLSASEVHGLAVAAFGRGGVPKGPTSSSWSVAGNCTDPRPFTLEGRPLQGHPGLVVKDRRVPYWLDLEVRCRRCAACLKARAHHWAERAIREFEYAERTWFGTLTMSPQEHWASEARARRRYGDGFGEARTPRGWREPPDEYRRRVGAATFARLHAANGTLLTKWLKRVRKESGASLRYLLVAEAHKSGWPHYHILVHQAVGSPPVLHKHLARKWPHGFSQFKLADPSAARYVCKYLAKAAEARIRASLYYGHASASPSASGVANRGGRRPIL